MVNWNLESDGSVIIEDKKCRAPPMHITVIRKTAVADISVLLVLDRQQITSGSGDKDKSELGLIVFFRVIRSGYNCNKYLNTYLSLADWQTATRPAPQLRHPDMPPCAGGNEQRRSEEKLILINFCISNGKSMAC